MQKQRVREQAAKLKHKLENKWLIAEKPALFKVMMGKYPVSTKYTV